MKYTKAQVCKVEYVVKTPEMGAPDNASCGASSGCCWGGEHTGW